MNNIFGNSSAGITKGKNYIFPRVAKNNRAVLPNCARGVTTYRKTFLEVHYLGNYGHEEVVLSIQMGDVISNMSDMQCFMARPTMEEIAENRIDVKHIKLEIFDLVMKHCQTLNVSASHQN